MFSKKHNSYPLLSVLIALLLLLANVGTAAASAVSDKSGGKACDRVIPFNSEDFTHPLKTNNKFMPLTPGTQLVYTGFITPKGGTAQPVDHQVIFTVTDLVKVINGVRTRVIYDVDVNEGETAEAELAFFAQDKNDNVWNLGEYPEEYENGEFAGAPNTWIAGVADAKGGVHMFGNPLKQIGKSTYQQGLSRRIDFLDCGQVVDKNQNANGYDNVLLTYETSPLDPEGGIQTKYYAPGVGIVQVGAIDDPEAETLMLTDLVQLSDKEMKQVREEALGLDSHAYEVSNVYRKTPPAKQQNNNDN